MPPIRHDRPQIYYFVSIFPESDSAEPDDYFPPDGWIGKVKVAGSSLVPLMSRNRIIRIELPVPRHTIASAAFGSDGIFHPRHDLFIVDRVLACCPDMPSRLLFQSDHVVLWIDRLPSASPASIRALCRRRCG